MFRPTGAVAAGLLLVAGCKGMEARRYASQMQGKPAPAFELTALDGTVVSLADFRGKPVVLSFWALG